MMSADRETCLKYTGGGLTALSWTFVRQAVGLCSLTTPISCYLQDACLYIVFNKAICLLSLESESEPFLSRAADCSQLTVFQPSSGGPDSSQLTAFQHSLALDDQFFENITDFVQVSDYFHRTYMIHHR